MTRNATAQALEELRGGATRLAEELVEFETSAELALLRDASALRGRSAELAAAAVTGATELWAKYPLLQGALEQLDTTVRNRDDVAAAPLLAQARELLASLTKMLAETKQAVNDVARRWREILPKLDQMAGEIAELRRLAGELELGDDRDLEHASRIVDHLMETIAGDPLGTDTLPGERAIDLARVRLRKLEHMQIHLPSDLEHAERTLAEIERVVAEGRASVDATRARIVGVHALLEPLPDDVLDADERALRPWLARLRALAAKGQWRPAATGLEQWRVVADGLLANARTVLTANRAPLAKRDELRGLLEAYRAKAAATGRAEDVELATAARAARDALYSAPCDVEAAAALVRAYGAAVNTAPRGGNP